MFTAVRKISSVFASRRLFCSAVTSANPRPFGHTRAILAGKVCMDPLVHENGLKAFWLKTVDENANETIHRVHTRSNQNIIADQLVYLIGFLNINEFTNADGKRRCEGRVRATDISTIGANHKNMNSIELHGAVACDVISGAEFSMFRVVSKFVTKPIGEIITQFTPVRVYDKALRELVDVAVAKRNVVRLFGALETIKDVDQNGGKQRNAMYIRATNILVQGARSHEAIADDEYVTKYASESVDK